MRRQGMGRTMDLFDRVVDKAISNTMRSLRSTWSPKPGLGTQDAVERSSLPHQRPGVDEGEVQSIVPVGS